MQTYQQASVLPENHGQSSYLSAGQICLSEVFVFVF